MKHSSAFLIIDLQNDFCPGGSLAVPHGNEIVPVVNRCLELFAEKKIPVIASRDWHPARSSHFREFGGIWPPHCIQVTHGAKFHPGLHLPSNAVIVSKGMDPERNDYSAFRAMDARGMDLEQILEEKGINHLYVAGLATDYCVKESVLDALRLGFAVTVISDAVMGVELQEGDSQRATKEMTATGAKMRSSHDLGV